MQLPSTLRLGTSKVSLVVPLGCWIAKAVSVVVYAAAAAASAAAAATDAIII